MLPPGHEGGHIIGTSHQALNGGMVISAKKASRDSRPHQNPAGKARRDPHRSDCDSRRSEAIQRLTIAVRISARARGDDQQVGEHGDDDTLPSGRRERHRPSVAMRLTIANCLTRTEERQASVGASGPRTKKSPMNSTVRNESWNPIRKSASGFRHMRECGGRQCREDIGLAPKRKALK